MTLTLFTARLSLGVFLVLVSSVARELQVIDNREEYISTVARAAEDVLRDAIVQHGEAHLVLTGGTMGIAVLTGFGVGENARVDWNRVHLWWGDERFVEATSPDRNSLQARNAFVSRTGMPANKIHEMPASDQVGSLDGGASAYAQTLVEFSATGTVPRFDLTFLGIGPDSHVASLFPGHPDAVKPGTCVSVRNSPKPPPERISLTFEALNTSERIWVVACGADKAEALYAMTTHVDDVTVPSSCVHGRTQTMIWPDAAASRPPARIGTSALTGRSK